MIRHFISVLAAVLVTVSIAAHTHTGSNAKKQTHFTFSYGLDTLNARQQFQGWGVSLCWWANMCGKWSDEKIDEIIDWLTSPDQLNFSIFRYNIGGGEDPANRACNPHHMKNGKGLRAEMEGFKDSTNGAYHWERDEAQRKIMLRIKQKRPDAVFEAFSNSCPYYMTHSGCVAGARKASDDNLKPEYYDEFARYLVDVCKHYKEAYGLEFHSLEPFNEAMSNYWYANGSQEGCHFDKQSQVRFVKTLSRTLTESGLRTIISASDETSVAQSLEALQCYRDSGVLNLIGQWNTHTYIANDNSREALRNAVASTRLPFWMSETGNSGKGIAGNLKLAQTLISDLRIMQPSAWLDWQYIEENNDQWCLVRADFSKQTYSRVKNFHVRRQFSGFIHKGYRFIATECPQTLAAANGDGSEYVVVMLNGSDTIATHDIDVSHLGKIKQAKAWRTSESEDVAPVNAFARKRKHVVCTLPPMSVTTLVLKK